MKTTTLLVGVLTLTAGASGYAVVKGSVNKDLTVNRPITRMELDHSAFENAYDAVAELRNGWLNEDPEANESGIPAVFVEMGCPEIACLRWLGLKQIEEIRFLDQDNTRLVWPRTQQSKSIVVMLRTREANPDPDPSG